jgi:hypothetical protein
MASSLCHSLVLIYFIASFLKRFLTINQLQRQFGMHPQQVPKDKVQQIVVSLLANGELTAIVNRHSILIRQPQLDR